MTNGEKVVLTARKYLGVFEEWGPNKGRQINEWQAQWGWPNGGYAWCGVFVNAMFTEAGVDDSGIGHPSVQVMCNTARNVGAFYGKHGGNIPTGAIIAKCGIHTGIVQKDLGSTLLTIEGNASNSVREVYRARADWDIIIPQSIIEDAQAPTPVTITVYGFDDLYLKPKVYGGWAKASARENVKTKFKLANPDWWVRDIRIDTDSPYAFQAGREGTYGKPYKFGPWSDKATRDRVMQKREDNTKRKMRPWNEVRTVADENLPQISEDVDTL